MIRPKSKPQGKENVRQKSERGADGKQLSYGSKSISHPVVGWVSNLSLLDSKAGAARILENFWPDESGSILRRGNQLRATVSAKAVRSLLEYSSGNSTKIFAVSNNKIFDVTTPASPTVSPPALVSTGITSSVFWYEKFTAVGADFTIAVNGVDPHLVYDGATWQVNTPAITGVGGGVRFSHVAKVNNRLFLPQAGSKVCWYLPVDSVGGVALDISFAGTFDAGDELYAVTSWSSDSGSGSNERTVFISKRGKIAVYNGNNPSNPATWSLFGVYDIPPPRSKQTVKIGGDTLILTELGILSMSSIATIKEQDKLLETAITNAIKPDWQYLIGRTNGEISFSEWSDKGYYIVGIPGQIDVGGGGVETVSNEGVMLVCNVASRAWAKHKNRDVYCLSYVLKDLVYGTTAGRVVNAEFGGTDFGSNIYYRFDSWPGNLGEGRPYGTIDMCRTHFQAAHPYAENVNLQINRQSENFAYPSAAILPVNINIWDGAGTWDSGGFWDVGDELYPHENWHSIGKSGYLFAVSITMTHSSTTPPSVKFLGADLTYTIATVLN